MQHFAINILSNEESQQFGRYDSTNRYKQLSKAQGPGPTPCPAATDRKAQMKRHKQHEKTSYHT